MTPVHLQRLSEQITLACAKIAGQAHGSAEEHVHLECNESIEIRLTRNDALALQTGIRAFIHPTSEGRRSFVM